VTDLAFLEAYVAISEVKGRYCRALDTKDWAGFADVFTDDIAMDTRPSGGSLTEGRDAVLAMVRASLETAKTAHTVHTPLIELDGDVADVVWAMTDRVVWGEDRAAQMPTSGLTGYGHYTERYVRRDGRWRIAKTVLSRLHIDFHPKA
jgi:uncharacterized protein (TIGR02246 family)